MRRLCVAWWALVCPGSAYALDADLTTTASVVPGTSSPATTVSTLSGAVPIAAESDPTLRFGLGAAVEQALGAATALRAAWGLYRVQAFCDTCATTSGPGWQGPELVRSTDLSLSVVHTEPLGDHARAILDAGATLPASRAALVCNPMYAAPGAGASLLLPLTPEDEGSALSVGVRARRPIYRYDAVPVGLCAPALRGQTAVDTLAGPVEPTPWDGERFVGSNPILTGAATLRWSDPHALLFRAPHLTTELATGLEFARSPAHDAVAVSTSSGSVTVPDATNPVRTVVPWSIEAGWSFGSRWSTAVSVSNRLPTLVSDPGGTFRAQPATTAVGWSLSAHL